MSCKHGHIVGCYKNGRCKECGRLAAQLWRTKNPDKVIAISRRWEREHPEEYKEQRRLRRLKNRDKINRKQREWRAENPDKVRKYLLRWRRENPEKFDECRKRWAKNNPQKMRLKGKLDQAMRRAARPKWANKDKIKVIYAACPEGYEVDHIIPINGRNVCGLHVETNLQYLTPKENKSKGNSLVI